MKVFNAWPDTPLLWPWTEWSLASRDNLHGIGKRAGGLCNGKVQVIESGHKRAQTSSAMPKEGNPGKMSLLTELCLKKTYFHLVPMHVTPLPSSLHWINLAPYCPWDRIQSLWYGSTTHNTLNYWQFLKYTIILHNNMTLNMLLPATRNTFPLWWLLPYVSLCNISIAFSMKLSPDYSKCLLPLCVCAYSWNSTYVALWLWIHYSYTRVWPPGR